MVVSVSQSHSHAAPGSAPSPDLATLLAKVEATSHRRECAPPLRGATLTPSNSIAPRICWPLLQSAFVKPGFGTKAEWVGSQKFKKDTPAPRKLFVFFSKKEHYRPPGNFTITPSNGRRAKSGFWRLEGKILNPPRETGSRFGPFNFKTYHLL